MTLVQINDMHWRSGSCAVPGQGQAGWYAESRLPVTADILREAVRDYKNSLPLLSPFLPRLSCAKSGSVCYYGIQTDRRPSSDTVTYSPLVLLSAGGNHTLIVITFPAHLWFSPSLLARLAIDCAPRGHVFSFNPGFGTWHELSLGHSSQADASPFDPSREIHLDYLI